LPLYALNWTGRMIEKDGSSQEVKLEPKFQSKKVMNLSAVIDKNGKISGKYRVQRTDYDAFSFREKYSDVNQQNYLEKVENDLPGIQISDYNIENSKDLSKPIIESFAFTTDNQIEIIGDKMYINPQLFFLRTKNPFVQEKREFPIYFGYSEQERFNFNFEIPEGYVVESMPKPIKLQTGGSVISFTFNCVTTVNTIQVAITKDVNTELVDSSSYPILKDFFRQMIDKQNEKIVLRKI
jgi:hypothetical protein